MLFSEEDPNISNPRSSGRNLVYRALDKASSPFRLLRLSFKAEGRCVLRSYIAQSVPSLPSSDILYKPASALLSSAGITGGSARKWLCRSTSAAPQIFLCGSKPILVAFQNTLSPSVRAWIRKAVEKGLLQQVPSEYTSTVSVLIEDIYPAVQPMFTKATAVVFAVFGDGEVATVPYHESLSPSYDEVFQKTVLSLRYIIFQTQASLRAVCPENSSVQKLLRKWLAFCKSLLILSIQSLTKVDGKSFNELLEDFIHELHLDPHIEKILLTSIKSAQGIIYKAGPAVLNFIFAVSPRMWALSKSITPVVVDYFCSLYSLVLLPCVGHLPHISKCVGEAASASTLSTAVQVLQHIGKVLLPVLCKLSAILYTNLCIVYPEVLALAQKSGPQSWLVLKNIIWPSLWKGVCHTLEHLWEIWPDVWCYIRENAGNLQTAFVTAYPHMLASAIMISASLRKSAASVNSILRTCCPIMGMAIHRIIKCSCAVNCVLIPLLWDASCEIAPVLWEEVILVLWSGFHRVAPSLISAAEEVTPVLLRAQLEVMWTVWFAACEVCPVLRTALMEISPVINQAVCTVTPVACLALSVVAVTVLKACKDEVLPKTWYAACEVAPHLCRAFCAVSSATGGGTLEMCSVAQTAAMEVSRVLAGAGVEVFRALETAFLEMCRVSDVALEEVTSSALRSVFREAYQVAESVTTCRVSDVALGEVTSSSALRSVFREAHQVSESVTTCPRTSCSPDLPSRASICNKYEESTKQYSVQSLGFQFSSEMYVSWISTVMHRNTVVISNKAMCLLEMCLFQGRKSFSHFIQILLPVLHRCTTVLKRSVLFSLRQTANSLATCVYHSVTVSVMCSVSFSMLFYVLEMSLSAEYRLCLFLDATLQLATNDMHLLLPDLLLKLSPIVGRLILKTSLKIWKSACTLVSKCWDLILKFSPLLWSVICQLSPLIFETACTICRKMWVTVCRVSPRLWHLLCVYVPQMWAVVCYISPPIWWHSCEVICKFWTVLCQLSPVLWTFLCTRCPVLWYTSLDTNAFLWETFCLGSACLWKTVCTSTAVVWHSSCHGVAAAWNCSCPAVFHAWSTSNCAVSVMWSCFRTTSSSVFKILDKAGSSVQVVISFASTVKVSIFNSDAPFCYPDFRVAGMSLVKRAFRTSSVISPAFTAHAHYIPANFTHQGFPFSVFRVSFRVIVNSLNFIFEVVRNEASASSSIAYSALVSCLPKPHV